MQSTRILIVDDHQVAAISLARYLEAVTGYQADAAGNAAEAINLMAEEPQYAAAVIDLVLHLESGLDVARSIKGLSPSTMVILVSGANAFGSFAVEAMERVVDYRLCRPIDVTELVQLIRSADDTSSSSHRCASLE